MIYITFNIKIYKDKPYYPVESSGSIWYASRDDGHKWEEKGVVIDYGDKNSWDGNESYIPNIINYKEKFYLVYTAMLFPFDKKYSQESIGIAVSDSLEGPQVKVWDNNLKRRKQKHNL